MQPTKHRTAIVLLLAAIVCITARNIVGQPAPVPETVLSAHTVFIENETGFAELQYIAVLEMNKWGQFQLAESREKSDLVLVLSSGTHVRAIPDGQYPGATGLNAFSEESVPKGHTKLTLQDPKSGTVLWSDFHKTEGGKVKSGHLLDELRQAFEDAEKTRNKR
jgi:hypothetical protein